MERNEAKARLEYLRGEIRGECISYGEICELQELAEFIEPDDVELLSWVAVEPEKAEELQKPCQFESDPKCRTCGSRNVRWCCEMWSCFDCDSYGTCPCN